MKEYKIYFDVLLFGEKGTLEIVQKFASDKSINEDVAKQISLLYFTVFSQQFTKKKHACEYLGNVKYEKIQGEETNA